MQHSPSVEAIVAVPLMVVIMLMAMQQQVMGAFTLPRPLWAMGGCQPAQWPLPSPGCLRPGDLQPRTELSSI